MRIQFTKHPYSTAVLASVLTIVFGGVVSIIIGIAIMASQPCEMVTPNDPCDGAPMAAGFVFDFLFSGTLVIAFFIGGLTFGILKRKSRESLSTRHGS
jgi:hypothetical protein